MLRKISITARTMVIACLMVLPLSGVAHAQFEALIIQMLQQAASAPPQSASQSNGGSLGNSAVTNVANQLSGMKYEFHYGYTPNSPSVTAEKKSGDCKDFAVYFTDTLTNMGLQTEIVAENYKLPSGATGGHAIGIATDGVHAWVQSDITVKMFNSVDEAVANGGVGLMNGGFGLPAGTTVSNQNVYSGKYVEGQQLRPAQ